MSISSRAGDDGTTTIIGEKRYSKNHPLLESLGTLDELNAFLGDAKAAVPAREHSAHKTARMISAIQTEIFTISGILAGSAAPIPSAHVLDSYIAALEAELPPLTGFALTGENPLSAKLHIARTVCRRAERQLVSLGRTDAITHKDYSLLLVWINRLSDLLFLLARQESGNQSDL